MELKSIAVENPEQLNFILGQTHFIKSIEDIPEAIVCSAPSIRFGVAFCEASGPALVRVAGNDPKLSGYAQTNAARIGAGHTFIIFLEQGFPINVLNAVKSLPEVCSIFCATANPVEVIVAESEMGRGIMGVIDGVSPKGIETEADEKARKSFLRAIGYKF